MPTSNPSGRAGLVREAVRGVGAAVSGLRTWGTSPRLMALGLVPGAITAVVFAVLAVVILLQLDEWSRSIAGALVDGDGWLSGVAQVGAALAILAGAALVAVYAFTAVTLLAGQPFFERLSRDVDAAAGFDGSDPGETAWRSTVRGMAEALRLACLTVPLAIGLFLVGLVPVVGGAAAFTLGAVFGGWFVALELTTYPLARRGVVSLRDRRTLLRGHRWRVIGFGAACFLAFLVPLGAVAFMPAAVAGATQLVQRLGVERGITGPRPPAPPS